MWEGGVKLEIPWDEGALKGGLAISGFTKGGGPNLGEHYDCTAIVFKQIEYI